jgi:hypothetical protein
VHRFNLNLNELTLSRTDNYRSDLENMEYFSYLVNPITKDARCTREIMLPGLPKKKPPSTRRRLFSPENKIEI